jgi:hypothetical protein
MNRKIKVLRMILNMNILALLLFNKLSAQNAPDLKKLISVTDLIYDKPVTRSEEGMPVGNGRIKKLKTVFYKKMQFLFDLLKT